ncbi:MAG: hypothetical protein KDK27_12870 [Leptospiraceae bacterium]|nr:hypothetical protein [Leptospiraceae bacterium]
MKRSLNPVARVYLFACTCILFLFASCSEKELPPIDARQIFTQLDATVQEYYFFQSELDLPSIYQSVARTAGIRSEPDKAREALLNQLAETNDRAAIYTALNTYLSALPGGQNDFYPAESLLMARESQRQAGVGIVFHRVESDQPARFLVVDVLEGSAAYRAGIEPGLFIEKVNGAAIDGYDMMQVLGTIKGDAGTTVTIGMSDGRDYELERGPIELRPLLHAEWERAADQKILYLVPRLAQEDTAAAIRGLMQRSGQPEAVVLDLRKYYHGDYRANFYIADLFLSSGQLGGLKLTGTEPETFEADADVLFKGPVYIIVGRHSSTIALALARIFQGQSNATIVGPGSMPLPAYLTHVAELKGAIEVHITKGYVMGPDGQALYQTNLQPDVTTEVGILQRPPLTTPDSTDNAQMEIARRLGM